jgi:transposase
MPKVVAEATGVSERTITRVLKQREHEEQGTLLVPSDKKHVPTLITGIDKSDKRARLTVHNLYAQERTVPETAELSVKPKERIHFKGSRPNLRRTVRKNGFRWKTTREHKELSLKGTI